MIQFASLVVPTFLAVQVAAHGFIWEAHIGGHKYSGNSVGNPPTDSVIWQLGSVEPIKGVDNKALTCGHGAKQAKLVANAMPGDSMTFDWRDGDGNQHWPHDVGPLLTYMASCGNKPCNEFDPSNAKWFKIQESGMLAGEKWKQADLKRKEPIRAKIPDNLAPGNYIVRSEIIALHLANNKGGAEFYVDCLQLKVGGSKSGRPKDSETVKFPGGYRADDAGIWFKDLYDHPKSYSIPGPPIASFITGRSNEDNQSNDALVEGSNDSQQNNAGQQNNSVQQSDSSPADVKGEAEAPASNDGNSNSDSDNHDGDKNNDIVNAGDYHEEIHQEDHNMPPAQGNTTKGCRRRRKRNVDIGSHRKGSMMRKSRRTTHAH